MICWIDAQTGDHGSITVPPSMALLALTPSWAKTAYKEFDELTKTLYGAEGTASAIRQNPEANSAQERLSSMRDALNACSRVVYGTELKVLDEIISELKAGRLIARGFRVQDSKVAEEQLPIPASHWQLLHFEISDEKRRSASGGGKAYTGLEIGMNENRS